MPTDAAAIAVAGHQCYRWRYGSNVTLWLPGGNGTVGAATAVTAGIWAQDEFMNHE